MILFHVCHAHAALGRISANRVREIQVQFASHARRHAQTASIYREDAQGIQATMWSVVSSALSTARKGTT